MSSLAHAEEASEKLTSMYCSSASRAPGSAAGTGSMQRKGVNRLAHHFTSAMPGWSGGSSSTNSPPSSRVCRRAEVFSAQDTCTHRSHSTATSCFSLCGGCSKVHNGMPSVLLNTNKACPQSGSAGALHHPAEDPPWGRGRCLEGQLSQQHRWVNVAAKKCSLRAPTSSPSSARQHALKSACLVGSKPPAATAYII